MTLWVGRKHIRVTGEDDNVSDPLHRRTFLRLGGIAGLPALAGCGELGAALGTRTETLGRVELQNVGAETVDVRLEVLRNGELVHESSYRVTPEHDDESPLIVEEWKDDPEARHWTVRAKTTESEWRDAELDAARDVNCHRVTVEADDSPGLPLIVLPHDCV